MAREWVKLSDQKDLLRRIGKGASWGVMGAIAVRVIALASTVLLARLLGRDDYGKYALLQSTFTTVTVFGTVGLGLTATKYVAELKGRDNQRLARVLLLCQRATLVFGACAAIFLFLSSSLIAESILGFPSLSPAINIVAVAVFFGALANFGSGVLAGFEAIRESVVGDLLAALVALPITVLLTTTYGLTGAAVGLAVAAGLRFTIVSWFVRERVRRQGAPVVRYRESYVEWRVLRSFALPALLSGIMIAPVHWVVHALLVRSPNGAAEMAVLAVAMQWFHAIVLLPIAAGRILLPVLTDTLASRGYNQARKTLVVAVLANLSFALPVAMIVALLSPSLMAMYGEEFKSEWPVMVAALTAGVITAAQAPIGHLLGAENRMWLGVMMNLGWAIAYIAGTKLLLTHGAIGVAIALAAAYALHAVWTIAYGFKRYVALRGSNLDT